MSTNSFSHRQVFTTDYIDINYQSHFQTWYYPAKENEHALEMSNKYQLVKAHALGERITERLRSDAVC